MLFSHHYVFGQFLNFLKITGSIQTGCIFLNITILRPVRGRSLEINLFGSLLAEIELIISLSRCFGILLNFFFQKAWLFRKLFVTVWTFFIISSWSDKIIQKICFKGEETQMY